MTDGLAYVEVRAARYLRAWPDVNEYDAIAVVRLHTAGLVSSYKDPSIKHVNGVELNDWKDHNAVLTKRGLLMAFYIQAQSFTYFTVGQALDMWSLTEIKAKGPKFKAFTDILRIGPPSNEIEEYLAKRTEEDRFPLITENFENPFTGKLIKDFPKIWEALLALGVEDHAAEFAEARRDCEAAASADDDADFGDFEIIGSGFHTEGERDAEIAAVVSEHFVPDPTCGYCEGTGLDPFEDGVRCPQCVAALTSKVAAGAPAADDEVDEWDIL